MNVFINVSADRGDCMSDEKKPKNTKRNVILSIIIIFLIAVISAVLIIIQLQWQNRTEEITETYTADDIVQSVIKKMKYTNLSPISADNINNYYELPEGGVNDSAMYISGKSDSELEITCFVLSSPDYEEDMMKCITKYMSSKTKASSDPNTSSAAINYTTSVHYPYVFIAVTPESEAAAKAFDSLLTIESSPSK